MHRGDHHPASRCFDSAPTLLRYLEGLPHDRLCRSRAEANDNLWLDEPDFLVEPGMTRPHLGVVRLLVDAARTLLAPLPLEVLHRVRDVHIPAIDACFLEGPIEESARWADKRMTGAIFLISGLFTDQHDPGLLRPFAKNRLRADRPQMTATATHRCLAQFWKRWIWRNEVGCRAGGDFLRR